MERRKRPIFPRSCSSCFTSTSTATSAGALSSTAPEVRRRRAHRRGHFRGSQAELRLGPAGRQGRQADQDRVRDGAVAPGQRHDQGVSGASGRKRAKHAAVLVIHENRGLNPYIEDVARRLGAANFIALRAGRADLGRRLPGRR